MAMKYESPLFFNYYYADQTHTDNKEGHIWVNYFYVKGGTSRFIHIDSTDDISIISELEQARQFKNIVVGVHGTMTAAVQLIDLAEKKVPFLLQFNIAKYSGNKLLEGYILYADDAVITMRPVLAEDHLIIPFSLPTVRLAAGKRGKKGYQQKIL